MPRDYYSEEIVGQTPKRDYYEKEIKQKLIEPKQEKIKFLDLFDVTKLPVMPKEYRSGAGTPSLTETMDQAKETNPYLHAAYSTGKDMSAVASKGLNAYALGVPEYLMKKAGIQPNQAESKAGKVGEFVSEIAGFSRNPAVKGLGRIASTAGPLLGRVAATAATGALYPQEDFTNIKERGKTALTSGALHLAGGLIKKGGKALLDGTLGKRVADYGKEKGFKEILNKEYETEVIPRKIVEKTDKFFPRAKAVTGLKVNQAVNAPTVKNKTVSLTNIKKQVLDLPHKGVGLDDLEITGYDKKLITKMRDKLLSIEGDEITIPELWKFRRDIDKLASSKSWSKPEAREYLDAFRRLLNDPIRNSDKSVAQAFDRYSFIMTAKDELSRHFEAVKDKSTGQIYGQKISDFINSFFSGKPKWEQVRKLKNVEQYLKPTEKVIDEMLNYGAAQDLGKGIGLPGWQKVLGALLGGRRFVAKTASKAQQAGNMKDQILKALLK